MDNKKTNIEFILICCCTCKRPKMLTSAINSVNNLIQPENIRVELLVIDNDENKSAKEVINNLSNNSKYKINYTAEEKRGICYARNRALEEAINLNASHIMFFDDDEIFDEKCLIEHVNLYKTNPSAIICSGPVWNRFEGDFPNYITKNILFKQRTTKKTGKIRNYCASGNVFFPVSLVSEYNLRFSDEYILMGGEDGDFFSKASKLGFTIVWNNEAIIYETVNEARANLKYIFKRSYYNGYSSSFLEFKNKSQFQKTKYLIKSFITLFLNCILLIPSILLGITVFINVFCMILKTLGKIDGIVKNKPMDFYSKIYGN